MPRLDVRLLGGFSLLSNGKPIRLESPRFQAFLASLLLHPDEPQSRARLAFVLWPDAPEPRARNNLRKLLHDLRVAWPAFTDVVDAGRDSITLRKHATVDVDVHAFEEAARRAHGFEEVRAAVSLYRGQLLPDCYEDWILPYRHRLQGMFIDLLQRGTGLAEASGDHASAVTFVQRLIAEEPLREDLYLDLMRLHSLSGNQGGALAAYHACASLLERELGVEPSREIEEAHRRLLEVAQTVGARVGAPPSLIGREAEWQILQAAWQRTLDHPPGVALITGDQGIGKTRLSEELRAWARRQELPIFSGASYSGDEALPFSVITRLLRSRPTPPLQPLWLRELSRLMPEVSAEPADAPPPTPLVEPWQRRLLFDAISRCILAAEPAILFLDDLQWADEDSLAAVRHVLHETEGGRILLVTTARWEEGEAARRLLGSGRVSEVFVEIDLDPLSRSDTEQLANSLEVNRQTGHWKQSDLDALFDQTEGNPLFVVELIRSGWPGNAKSLPGSIEAALARTFAGLPAGARDLLEVAATIGRAFPLSVLTLAAGQENADLVRNLDLLWHRRIIREGEDDRYDFSHGQLREVAYSCLSNARRTMLHGRVAAAYKEAGETLGEAANGEVGRHLELAGLNDEAAAFYVAQAEAAVRIYSHDAAELFFRRAIGLLPASRQPAVMLRLAETLQSKGNWDEASGILYEASRLARRLGDRSVAAYIRLAVGDSMQQKGQLREAREWLEDTLPEFESLGDKRGLCRTVGVLGEVVLWLADYQGGERLARRQLELAQALDDPAEIASAYGAIGTVNSRRSRFDEALEYYRLALSLEERLGDRARILLALGRVGSVLRFKGDLQPAKKLFRRQLDLAQEIGHRRAEALAMFNLGVAANELGDFEEALVWDEKSLAISKELGERRGQGAVTGNIGTTYYDLGDIGNAFRYLAESIEIMAEIGETRNMAVGIGSLASVYHAAGADAEAEAAFSASVAVSIQIDNPQNVAIVAGEIASARLDRGILDQSEAFNQRAQHLCRSLGMPQWLYRDLLVAARLAALKDQPEDALALLEEAQRLDQGRIRSEVRLKLCLFREELLTRLGLRQPDEAIADLERLFPVATRRQDHGAVTYAIWRIDPSREDNRILAETEYRHLYASLPSVEHAERLRELTGSMPPPLEPLPAPPRVILDAAASYDSLLPSLDRFCRHALEVAPA